MSCVMRHVSCVMSQVSEVTCWQNSWHITCDTILVTWRCFEDFMWHLTHYLWYVTLDMWHKTCDIWYITCDRLGLVDILLKFQLPSSNGLAVKGLWRWQLSHDTWILIHDLWHMTCKIWHMTLDWLGELDFLSKFQLLAPTVLKMTCDTWVVTCDMWYITHETWQVGGDEPSVQISAP